MDNSVLISEIVLKKERLPPVIVSFEHGKLMPPETSKLRSGVYRDKNNARKRVVAVATRSLLYTGVQAPWNSDMCRTFVGVRNKKTNKMRLLEAEYFQLSPAITLENCPIPQPKGYVIDTGDTKHAQLNKSFGSKNSKRRAEQQERTRMQLDNLKDQLNETSATVEVSKEDLSFSTLAGDDILVQYLPPFNEVASVVDRVYELNRILTEEELNSLEPKCQEILSNIDVYTHEMHTTFFKTCLRRVAGTNKTNILKALLYADCLLNFVRLTIKDLHKIKFNICPYSSYINNNILEKFTTNSDTGRFRSQTMKDKALCYIIVLGLIICNYQLNLTTLIESSKVGLNKLIQLSRAAEHLSKIKRKMWLF